FNDTATVSSGQSVNINVLANDSFEGSSVAVSSVTQGANGSVSINPDGTVKYTANAGFSGSDSFTYTAIGSTGVAETATVTVTVTTPPFTLLNNLQPRVSEEGLTNANSNFVSNPDTTGSSDTTNLATTAWTTVFNTNASTGYSYALTAPVTPLTSNGVAITWVGVGTATLVGQAAGIDVVRIQVNASGQYQVTLLDQVDHATANLEDVLSFGVGLTVTDLNNVKQSTTINVAIEDDSPIWDSTQNSGNPTANITVTTDIGVSPVKGDLNIHIGADNGSQAKVVFTAPAGDIQSTYIDPDGGATKTTYPTYKGMRLHYEAQPDGSLIAKASDGTAVFTIRGDLSTDTYSIEMHVKLDPTTYTATNFAGSLKGGNTPGTYLYGDNGQIFEINLSSTENGTASTVNTNQGFFGVSNNWIDGGEVLNLDFGTKMTGMVLKVNGLTGSEQMSYIARDEFGNIVGTGIISVGGPGWTTIDGQNGTFTLPVSTFTGGSFQNLTFSGVSASDSARIGLTSISGEGAVNQTITNISVGAVDSDGDALTTTKPISITLHSIDEDFRGTTGNDYFDGGTGDDRLFGDLGNDTLFGNVGSDQLYAGAGNDILIGGAGSDILNGSTGADTFVWGKQATGLSTLVANGLTDADASTDIIKDFSKAEGDKIDAKALLNALGWDNTMVTLGNYVSVSGNTIDIHNTTNTNHVSIVVENQTFSDLNDMITKTNFQTT
ncbi:Ig-like domain-containing protein, partial [Acinetobacter sp. ANC 4173]|uniref:Ig-like domain-containing protein n=1 Tax=Acinetobacter sp. ANC 4173 TaxID=2529837 RepID=UPI00103C619C